MPVVLVWLRHVVGVAEFQDVNMDMITIERVVHGTRPVFMNVLQKIKTFIAWKLYNNFQIMLHHPICLPSKLVAEMFFIFEMSLRV